MSAIVDTVYLCIRMATFIERLEKACQAQRSLLCVGLDPDPSRMPTKDIFQFNRAIIDATVDLVCAYKPNLAFYEALGLAGLEALQGTLEHIRRTSSTVLIIGDAKRGDIGSTSDAYAKGLFDQWGFDAATVNAYGGADSLEPFISYQDRGVFIWCRSSNLGARDFQDLEMTAGGQNRPLYQQIALEAQNWNRRGNIGLVVGATYPKEMEIVRGLCPDMPFLIPGAGVQSADLKEAVLSGSDSRGRRAIINSSRSILYASSGPDFAEAARKQAMELRDSINWVLTQEGLGWS